jgi:phosphate transport system substrate-binding protein
MQRRQLLLQMPALGLLPWSAHSAAQGAELMVSGSGATFPAKVYQQWAEQYARDTGVKVAYAPSGSSMGVRRMVDRAVDFGATDVPLSLDELDKHRLFQFPTLVGGVVPVVNLPGVPNGSVKLTAQTLGLIFSGQVTRWNDPAVLASNPGQLLPNLRITRVVRADGSGTTEVFVNYLKLAAADAAQAIEAQGSRAQWPGQLLSAEGSSKLVETLKATPGAIGYVSSDYVVREGLNAVSLRNKRGEWMAPKIEAFQAAIRIGELFKNDLRPTALIDIDGVGVWPIVSATYVLVPRTPTSLARGGRTLNFFFRSFLAGDKAVAGTGFAPLPGKTQARIVQLLSSFRTPDGQLVPVMTETHQPLVLS